MRLVIVSGLSGSGKSIALNTLEDRDFYCIDNLTPGLLTAFTEQLDNHQTPLYDKAAVGIDARSSEADMQLFPSILENMKSRGLKIEIVYLQAEINTLIKRFSETRRKHPLTHQGLPLTDAIRKEQALLSNIASHADIRIDTTHTNVHQLRAQIQQRLCDNTGGRMSLLIQSFGFKNGVPADSDFVFDVRCLPNPYWEASLRGLTGQDDQVVNFLEAHEQVDKMFDSIRGFLDLWIPQFEAENRSYLSVSIGCTGGYHRSVYLVERLAKLYRDSQNYNLTSRHRELV